MYSSGANNGFLIRDAAEDQDAEQQFNSREKGSNPPQLVITFGPPDTTAARDDDRLRARREHDQLERVASPSRSNEQNVTFECSLDNARVHRLHVAEGLHGPGARRARAARPRDGRGGQRRRHAGELHLDASLAGHDGARDHDRLRRARRRRPRARPRAFSFSVATSTGAQRSSARSTAARSAPAPRRRTTRTCAVGAHSFRVRAEGHRGQRRRLARRATSGRSRRRRRGCTASTMTAAADRDAWVLQSSPTSNFGNDSVLKVDSKSGGNARALVRFALPTIPSRLPGHRRDAAAVLRLLQGGTHAPGVPPRRDLDRGCRSTGATSRPPPARRPPRRRATAPATWSGP